MNKDTKGLQKVFFAGFILPLGLFGFSWGKVQLTHDGKSDYVIIQGASPSVAEKFAARELGDYLEKVTGAKLPILGETNVSGDIHGIYVGWTEFALRNGVGVATLGREEWVIQTVGKNLVLTGGRPVGTLYAVYEFLEKTVGCHWLDRDTEVIPRAPDLAISKLNIKDQPVFWHRYITPGTTIYSPDPAVPGLQEKEGLFRDRNKSTAWLARFGRVNYGSPGENHTFYAYSKDFPTNHPEYFSMNSLGKRDRATSGAGPGQLCMMNPEVRKLMIAQLRKFIIQDRQAAAKRNQPAPWVYDISQNDGGGQHICSCPTCRAFAEKEGAESGLMVDFINEIADGIKDEYPEVRVMTFAYATTVKAPRTIAPRDNVIIRLAQLNAEWANHPEELEHFSDIFRPMAHPINHTAYDDLAAWGKISRHLAIWDYWILYSPKDKFPSPYVNVSCIQPDLQLFLQNHAENIFVECEAPNTTSFSALKLWLGQKLLQNPNQPQAPLLETFMNGYYGAAAPQMKAYLEYMEKRIAAVPATNKLAAVREYQRPYLDLEFFTTANRLLTEAEQACRTDPKALAHVQHEWVPVCGALYNMWSQLEQQVAKGQKMPFDRDEILQKYAAQRRAILEAFYYGKVPQRYKDEVDKELKNYRELPAMEKRKLNPKPQIKAPAIPKAENSVPDGDLQKVDWSQASATGPWYTLRGFSTGRKPSARLAHDGKYLYIQLAEPCDVAKLNADSDICGGDDWEVFFAAQRGAVPYRQLCIGPEGKTLAYEWKKNIGLAPPVVWDSGARVVSDRSNNCWTVTLALPLETIVPGGARPGDTLYAHLFRATPRPGDHLAWSPTFDDYFHVLDRMGEIVLSP